MIPTQARLWLLLWTVMGLGLAGYAITLLRYAQGRYVVVPASAPFIDRAIWVGSWICVGGGVCVLVAWALIVTVRAAHPRSRRLGVLLVVVGGFLYVVAVLLLIVVGPRFLARVGRTPTLVSAAVADAVIVLALGAHALRLRPAPYSLRRWVRQYFVLMGVLYPLLGFVLAATLAYDLLWAALASFFGFVLMLVLVPQVTLWRRGDGGARGGGSQG
jgi:hypothetical protein